MRSPLLVLPLLVVACARQPAPAAPAPAPPPAPVAAPFPPPTASPVIADPAMMCVIQNGKMTEIEVRAGNRTKEGRRIEDAFPLDSTYAANADWYRDRRPIHVAGRTYVTYGLVRILGITDVVPVATYHGVTVFAEPRYGAAAEVIYLPMRPGCEFQPYQLAGTA
jgi:hypothetical protein